MSSWASSTLWLARISLPPSPALAASHSGLADAMPLLDEAAAMLLEGRGQGAHGLLRAVWWPSPMPMASVNSRRAVRVRRSPGRARPSARCCRWWPSRTPSPCGSCPSGRASRRSRPQIRNLRARSRNWRAMASAHSFFQASSTFVPGDVDGAGGVARAAAVEMRSQQRIDLEPRQQVRIAFQAHPLQHHGVVRVADDLLGERVAALGIAIDVADPERLGVDVLEGRFQVALLFVEEGLAVA